jgi:hypothetical protein
MTFTDDTPANDVDEFTVRRFITIVAEHAAKVTAGLHRRGLLQIVTMRPSDKGSPSVRRFHLHQIAEISDWCVTTARAGCNVWIEGRTVREGLVGNERGTLQDTVQVFALVIDSDADKNRALKIGVERASIEVETSPGNKQLWLFLTQVTHKEAHELGTQVRRATGTDDDTGTITQPYRVAGTPNYPTEAKRKRGRVTVEPTRILNHGGGVWSADDLRLAFKVDDRKAEPPPRSGGEESGGDESKLPPDLLKIIRDGVPEGKRSTTFHRVVAELKSLGWPIGSIVELFEKYPHGIASKFKGRIRKEVERSYGKVATGDTDLDDLNERFAVVPIGGNTRIMALNEVPPVYFRPGDFKTLLQNRSKDIGGGKTMPLSNWWLAHPARRQYGGLVFEPGEPEIVRGCRNLWTGFAVEPREGDCGLYLDFLREVICCGDNVNYKYLLDLMADTVQRPNKQGEIAVVLQGKEGVGKGFAVRRFGHLFGPHFLAISQSSQVVGKFNGHLAHCSILFADEAFFAGDRQHEAVLKALITEASFMIERKGVDAIGAQNLTHLWVSSNEDWVIPAGSTARRFFCLTVSDARRNDTAYFKDIANQLDNGGYASLLKVLLERNLTGVDLHCVPQTKSLAEQKALTRRGVDALVEWICDMGMLPCAHLTEPHVAITCDPSIKETFYDIAKRQIPGMNYIKPTTITRTLKADWGCEGWNNHGRRGIAFPPLHELRERFILKHGPTMWSSDASTWDAP